MVSLRVQQAVDCLHPVSTQSEFTEVATVSCSLQAELQFTPPISLNFRRNGNPRAVTRGHAEPPQHRHEQAIGVGWRV
jgi:hypothetical protein